MLVCAAGAEAQELGILLGAADAQVGKEISVRGPLRQASTVCTLALCKPGTVRVWLTGYMSTKNG